jgi:lipopolysaccharide export system protein LptC
MSKVPEVSSSPRTRFKLKKQLSHEVLTSPISEYSRRVKVLRKILPSAGFVLLAVIIAWPFGKQLYEKQYDDVSPVSKKLVLEDRLINPKLVDTDEKDHPFTLAAKSSVQGQENHATFEKPQGRIKTDQATDVEITADTGNFNKEASILTYKDNVILRTGDGYVFKTRQAQLHTKTHIATGHDPVTGHGPSGELKADKGFKLDKNQKTLTFYGQTRLIIVDKKNSMP